MNALAEPPPGVRPGYCWCGCPERITNRRRGTRYFSERHRQDAYRKRLKQAAAEHGVPSSLSFKTLNAVHTPADRSGDAKKAPATRKSGPSVRVSYRKALEAVARHLRDELDRPEAWVTQEARRILDPLLTDRQKEALHA